MTEHVGSIHTYRCWRLVTEISVAHPGEAAISTEGMEVHPGIAAW